MKEGKGRKGFSHECDRSAPQLRHSEVNNIGTDSRMPM
jgi:hypothetical protein